MRVSKEDIRLAIANSNIKVVSFDVFDTLLLRPFWKPADLFDFLNREASALLSVQDEIHFSEYRRDAERRARICAKAKGKEDVTLEEIYAILEKDAIFPGSVILALREKEMELEKDFCYPRESAVELMRYAVSQGKRVVAVSDMYLPSALIGTLFEKNGIPKPESLFVSGDIGLSKRTGHLYEYVLDTLKIQSSELIHIGDNDISDVRIPRRMGIKAFSYPRAVDLFSGKNAGRCKGKAFCYAYKQLRSPFPNARSLDKLGTRCMLAVAANRVYDDPYRGFNKSGEYAGDELLFGTVALGQYCMGQALWLERLTEEAAYDHVLFFSRDSFLQYKGFSLIEKIKKTNTASYVRISRKAIAPLLLFSEARLACAGTYIDFNQHSPQSLAKLFAPVLQNEAMSILEKRLANKWEKGFASETEMMQYLKVLSSSFVDREAMKKAILGFRAYFSRYMCGKVLTYDVGYRLRNEAMLHYFFPNVKIAAAYTHSTDDLALKRGKSGSIQQKTFYSSAPYVSWVPRELFLTENAPSCVGYSETGEVLFSSKDASTELIPKMQTYAVAFMEQFAGIFKEDMLWLPIDPADVCLPMEAFLHSPSPKDKKWVKGLQTDNSYESGLQAYSCQRYWKGLRMDYWIAAHHLDRTERHIARFLFLLINDRQGLKKAFYKRIPDSIRTHHQ